MPFSFHSFSFLGFCSFVLADKTIRKSFPGDEYLASTNNNIFDGGTYSNSWADGRDKGIKIRKNYCSLYTRKAYD
jgi:hypothetical protein